MSSAAQEKGSEEGLKKHKIIGRNTAVDVRVLTLIANASEAVLLIRLPNGIATGFLCAENIIMTCNHVISSHQEAHATMYEFFYELNEERIPSQPLATRAKPNGLFYTNKELDFTLVQIDKPPEGVLPLQLVERQSFVDDRFGLIHHPGGGYKKIAVQGNIVQYADQERIQYSTFAEFGSSGAPLFNMEYRVVGIHHSGGMIREPGSDKLMLRNEGITMIAVLEDLKNNSPQIYQKLNIA